MLFDIACPPALLSCQLGVRAISHLTEMQRGSAGASGTADGQLSDAQLNELLARGEEEAELFAAEDARMQVGVSLSSRG